MVFARISVRLAVSEDNLGEKGVLTTLSSRETSELIGIMQDLTRLSNSLELRQRVGERLLGLLNADFFASYVADTSGRGFASRVSVNMAPDNLKLYETYFQYRDPITQKLASRRQAAHVNEVIAQSDLEKTEFYNDFLQRDGLHHGVNYHAHDGSVHVGDLRVWRSRAKETFGRREIDILQAVGTAFSNALIQHRRFAENLRQLDPLHTLESLAEALSLTPREAEILSCMTHYGRDQHIADHLGVSITTVRTHIQRLFQKAGVNNRTALVAKLMAARSN
ncbi:LuxR family transcriptional regulator [Roseibium sp. TrichSKD4]|nr:LuxR family transcriptional regulator [Roseibium sp. TrichSKD4]